MIMNDWLIGLCGNEARYGFEKTTREIAFERKKPGTYRSCFMNIRFSQSAYDDFLRQKSTVVNTRIRPDDMSIWDAMLTQDADLATLPNGGEIISAIKNAGMHDAL
jgi:hypothetical protein